MGTKMEHKAQSSNDGMRFTIRDGVVFADFPDRDSFVPLGPLEIIGERMCRFLESIDYGKSRIAEERETERELGADWENSQVGRPEHAVEVADVDDTDSDHMSRY